MYDKIPAVPNVHIAVRFGGGLVSALESQMLLYRTLWQIESHTEDAPFRKGIRWANLPGC